MTLALVLSGAALGLALIAVGLSLAVMRQSGTLAGILERHRLGHQLRDGAKDPARSSRTERREVNTGPPPGYKERRQRPQERQEALPGLETLETSPQAVLAGEEPPTVIARRVRPRPGEIGRR